MKYNLEITQKVVAPIELNRANVVFTTGSGGVGSLIWGNIEGNIADQIDLKELLANKVDKINEKGLSTNDYTTEEKTKLSGITAGADVSVNPD
jgi:hypothetical protein